MAAYAALVSLINTIQQIINHPRLSTSLDNKQIQPLLEKADFLLDFMEANNYGGGSKEAEDLEREIASAAYAAEDVIESHIVDQIHAGATETSLRCSLDLQQKTQDMEAVMKKANAFKGKQGSREEQPTHATLPVMEIGETAMVGLDAELDQLVLELTGYQSSRHTISISIVGMGGTGKTTLARNIFQHPLTKEHFHCRAWATISQQHNAQEILSHLLSGLGKPSNGSVGELGLKLHQSLTGRRYLIILDDIWGVEAWNEVRRFIPDNKNGSRVVLTTRLSNVANDCGSSPFVMKFLDEAKSWELFCEKAFKNEPCPPELREVGWEIVKLCKGLALSIVVTGGLLLKSPRTVEYWKSVLKDMKSISDSKEKQESLDVLSLSYNHLPPHLKPCFLYMGVFKEDSEIRVSNVVQLWVAEGFIKPNESRVLEEIGEGYLQDLIDRNLILVGRRRRNGKIICCGIHDLLRDLCIKVDVQGIERRVGCKYTTSRSIITGDTYGKLVKYRLLRIWGQGDYGSSPAELFESVNLRYLSYKHLCPNGSLPYVWELPTSVSLMWNLQTLIIIASKSTLIIVLPTEIWKMPQLRHVECNKIYLPAPPPSNGQDESLSILDNLQTLKTALNLSLCEEVCKIIPNIKKLHLCYDHDLHGYDDGLIKHLRNLGRLHKLESLNLSIKSGKRVFRDTQLKKILRFPSSLNKLSLSNCQLQWEDMRVIGSLPQLQVLMLESHSVDGRRWDPLHGQFLHLRFLKISCHFLKNWNADRSHFPVLEKLVLADCRHLKEIPSDIGEIATLQLIRVEHCSVDAAVSAVKMKEDQLENMGDDGVLEVQVRMYGSDEASFRIRVESINHIQLEIV